VRVTRSRTTNPLPATVSGAIARILSVGAFATAAPGTSDDVTIRARSSEKRVTR
jgi:hypothetical protein